MKKRSLISLFLVLLMIAASACLFVSCEGNNDPGGEKTQKHFTFICVGKDGEEKKIEIVSDAVFLSDALLEKGLIEMRDGMIITVCGITADYAKDGAYWSFYVDGNYAMLGADATKITEGGVYRLEYTAV